MKICDVYAKPGTHKDDQPPEDVQKMEKLGWFWHDEYDCWAMHT